MDKQDIAYWILLAFVILSSTVAGWLFAKRMYSGLLVAVIFLAGFTVAFSIAEKKADEGKPANLWQLPLGAPFKVVMQTTNGKKVATVQKVGSDRLSYLYIETELPDPFIVVKEGWWVLGTREYTAVPVPEKKGKKK